MTEDAGSTKPGGFLSAVVADSRAMMPRAPAWARDGEDSFEPMAERTGPPRRGRPGMEARRPRSALAAQAIAQGARATSFAGRLAEPDAAGESRREDARPAAHATTAPHVAEAPGAAEASDTGPGDVGDAATSRAVPATIPGRAGDLHQPRTGPHAPARDMVPAASARAPFAARRSSAEAHSKTVDAVVAHAIDAAGEPGARDPDAARRPERTAARAALPSSQAASPTQPMPPEGEGVTMRAIVARGSAAAPPRRSAGPSASTAADARPAVHIGTMDIRIELAKQRPEPPPRQPVGFRGSGALSRLYLRRE
jgi:hypothetical protein